VLTVGGEVQQAARLDTTQVALAPSFQRSVEGDEGLYLAVVNVPRRQAADAPALTAASPSTREAPWPPAPDSLCGRWR
jgi:hypothetical protein